MRSGARARETTMVSAAAGALGRESLIEASEQELQPLVQARLGELLPKDPGLLALTARDALLRPGKRVRPIVAMLAGAHVGGRAEAALDFGCAVEMVHAASLALDDLPCMDDASLRRGQPALHRLHGEDAAVLAAIALLNQATRVVLASDAPAQQRLDAVELLTEAVGFDGLCHGQMQDLRAPVEERHVAGLRRINDLKTGALFVAAVRGGGLMSGASADQLACLSQFGRSIGFAFQLLDDLLDAVGEVRTLGKDVGQDEGLVTFVDVWGMGRVRAAIGQSLRQGAEAVGSDSPLHLYVLDLFHQAEAGI